MASTANDIGIGRGKAAWQRDPKALMFLRRKFQSLDSSFTIKGKADCQRYHLLSLMVFAVVNQPGHTYHCKPPIAICHDAYGVVAWSQIIVAIEYRYFLTIYWIRLFHLSTYSKNMYSKKIIAYHSYSTATNVFHFLVLDRPRLLQAQMEMMPGTQHRTPGTSSSPWRRHSGMASDETPATNMV